MCLDDLGGRRGMGRVGVVGFFVCSARLIVALARNCMLVGPWIWPWAHPWGCNHGCFHVCMHVLGGVVLTGELGALRLGRVVFFFRSKCRKRATRIDACMYTHDLLLAVGQTSWPVLLGSSSELSCPSSDDSMPIASVLGLISWPCLSGFGSSLSRDSSALLPASSSSTFICQSWSRANAPR